MIKMRLTPGQAKAGFFDREAVKRSIDRAERRQLGSFGAFVRKVAKSSIKSPGKKRQKDATQALSQGFLISTGSKPGEPPKNQTGLLKKFIFFAYDRDSRSVVIGPTKLNKRGSVPELLEKGGTQVIKTGQGTALARYAPRPYMQPAFDIGLDQVERLWKDSIK